MNGIQTRLHGALRNPIHMAPERLLTTKRQLAKKTTIQVYLIEALPQEHTTALKWESTEWKEQSVNSSPALRGCTELICESIDFCLIVSGLLLNQSVICLCLRIFGLTDQADFNPADHEAFSRSCGTLAERAALVYFSASLHPRRGRDNYI